VKTAHFFDPDSMLEIGAGKIAGSRPTANEQQNPDADITASPGWPHSPAVAGE
jgi:hypothetical protein